MQTLIKDTKNIRRDNAFRAALRAVCWILKTSFKLVLVVGSTIVALLVFLFDNDDGKEEETESASSIHARRGIGLSNSDRTKLDNSIHSGDDY